MDPIPESKEGKPAAAPKAPRARARRAAPESREGKPVAALVAAIDALVDRAVTRRAARLARPRWLRCSPDSVSLRQRRTLEAAGVPFAKIGKTWCYDGPALDAYVERQRGGAAANDPAADDDAAEAMLAQIAGGGR